MFRHYGTFTFCHSAKRLELGLGLYKSSAVEITSSICLKSFKLNSSICGLISRTERKSLHIKEELIPSLEIAMKHPKACTNVAGLPFLSMPKSEEILQEVAMGARPGDRWCIGSWASAHMSDSSMGWLILILTPRAFFGFPRIRRCSALRPSTEPFTLTYCLVLSVHSYRMFVLWVKSVVLQ